MEDALVLAKDIQAVDLAWFDELRGQIAALEREVEQFDAATAGSGGLAAARGPLVGASSFLDETAVLAAFSKAQADLSEHPVGLQVLEVLRAGLNQAVVGAPPAASSLPPAPSPGAAEVPVAAPAEPAESVVSSIDGLADLSDTEDYDKLQGLLESSEEALRSRA